MKNFITDNLTPSSRPRLVLLALIYIAIAHLSRHYNKLIHTHCYGEIIRNECRGHKFKQDNVMHMCLAFTYVAVAKAIMMIMDQMPNIENKIESKPPKLLFWFIGTGIVLSLTFSQLGKEQTTYSIFTAFTSSLPLIVLISCLILSKKIYEVQKYFIVMSIIFGLFWHLNDYKSGSGNVLGVVYMILSVLIFGATQGLTERVRMSKSPSTLNYIMWINLFAGPIYVIPIIIYDESFDFFVLSVENLDVYFDIAIMALYGFIMTFISYLIVVEYGVLTAVILYAARDVFVTINEKIIDGSILTVDDQMNNVKWIGFGILMVGLVSDLILGDQKFCEHHKDDGEVELANATELQTLNSNNNENNKDDEKE
ncbi:solute carrier family 35 member B1 homolog [Chironomus tepperi]|uniref:solute carrier family 35 member B1 homolog n=1 Tax=Chironomus tepperi TaxID=113505 RepID=UPI00391F31CC